MWLTCLASANSSLMRNCKSYSKRMRKRRWSETCRRRLKTDNDACRKSVTKMSSIVARSSATVMKLTNKIPNGFTLSLQRTQKIRASCFHSWSISMRDARTCGRLRKSRRQTRCMLGKSTQIWMIRRLVVSDKLGSNPSLRPSAPKSPFKTINFKKKSQRTWTMGRIWSSS